MHGRGPDCEDMPLPPSMLSRRGVRLELSEVPVRLLASGAAQKAWAAYPKGLEMPVYLWRLYAR
jgi:hypothetical protein